ncbi:MAG: hypothetical protein US60_C0054G0009 [Microgenomates group bacterium GW2011_GWC1_37_8]|uniref:VIT family protein n=2 Tax=Candidatus Woeseibacteriota TaxID=1752722 RepID=A0A0G0L153_9BACT|nr:MAG: hypothetical protein US60_C0054G0009 [Microgenomates group bacterium GW2011_GWC1_37_8]KKQ85673.1 MAG: hypothetical protein UT08_C0005G0124 [Candidatus Woesebacteria bacterium GW2011_GWB1_38_8]OGM21969.1 MAG: hypothetical protein A2863_03215 [Candidatus Woesebacteria bacterium RIFCSPHIGHO2_01_FULL_38_9b]
MLTWISVSRITIHEKAGYLADAVFAASDGMVTTFAIVAGSAGASLGASIVLILGFANLFADGFSMAAGNYLGVKSEIEYEEVKRKETDHEGSPIKHGLVTFVSFNIAGLIPLLPFLFKIGSSFVASTVFVGFSLFAVGFLRSIYTRKNVIKSGTEMFAVGGLAAFVAFVVGYLIDLFLV